MNYTKFVTEEFWNTGAKATQSFHDGEDEEFQFPYHRTTIGSLFHFAEEYGLFVRETNNCGRMEQRGTALMFRIHFGDSEIADHFQEVIEYVGAIEVHDIRGDLNGR